MADETERSRRAQIELITAPSNLGLRPLAPGHEPGTRILNGITLRAYSLELGEHIVPVDDHSALAGRLQLLLDDPALQDELGAAGRNLVCADHQYERLIRDFIGVYRKAGAGRGNVNDVVDRGASEPQMGETPAIGR